MLQHGNYMFVSYEKFLVNKFMFVWGDFWKQSAIEAGVQMLDIISCGNHKLSKALKNHERTSQINQKKKLLYIAPKGGGHLISVPIAEALFKVVDDGWKTVSEGFELLVKAHPYDKNTHIFNSHQILKGENLFELLREVDLVVAAGYSTAINESLAFDIPVILVSGTEFKDYLHPEVLEARPTPLVGTGKELAQLLQRFQEGDVFDDYREKRREFVRARFGDMSTEPYEIIGQFLIGPKTTREKRETPLGVL